MNVKNGEFNRIVGKPNFVTLSNHKAHMNWEFCFRNCKRLEIVEENRKNRVMNTKNFAVESKL